MLYGNFVKLLLVAILLGLLLFLGNTKLGLMSREGVLRLIRPLTQTGFNLRQTWSPAEKSISTPATNVELEELRSENQLLRRALRLSEQNSLPPRGANVTHYRLELRKEFLFIDKGMRAGIKRGDLAIDQQGFLVGLIEETYQDMSRVSVISNPGQTLEVELLPLRVRALAKGIGGGALLLELLAAEIPVRVGDFAIILGIGGTRYSFPLAEIAGISSGKNNAFKEARAVLLGKPQDLRELFIVESRLTP
jgi:cell shape-determining protein MreC